MWIVASALPVPFGSCRGPSASSLTGSRGEAAQIRRLCGEGAHFYPGNLSSYLNGEGVERE